MLRRPPKIDPPAQPKYDKHKAVVVGSQGVGKTAMLRRFVDGTFIEKYEPTVGSDFFTHKSLGDKNIALTFFDLSGNQDYLEVRNEFYKDAQLAIVCYDITDPSSYSSIDRWVAEIAKHGGEKLPITVVGTKSDLASRRSMPKDTANADCVKKDYAGYYEVSAKAGEGYEDLLIGLKRILKENL